MSAISERQNEYQYENLNPSSLPAALHIYAPSIFMMIGQFCLYFVLILLWTKLAKIYARSLQIQRVPE